jgi:hypothetical protein
MTSLYTRMRTNGTLTETPEEIPDAVFAWFCRKFWRTADQWIWLGTVIQREPQIA